jgi:tetratricopeptide (TPR) repeat protein
MRLLPLVLCACALGCVRPRAQERSGAASSGDGEASDAGGDGLVGEPTDDGVGTAWRTSPAARARSVALLRELAARSTGLEELEAEARLFHLLDESGEVAERAEALALGLRLVARSDFPQLTTGDQVLHALGGALVAARRRDEARRTWTRLVTERPDSRLVAAAAVGLGDLAFDDGELIAARAQYTLAAADPQVGAYARYKHAWTTWNLGDEAAALAAFLELARHGPPPIRAAARTDLLRVYATAGAAADAAQLFGQLDRAAAPAMLITLGDQYRQVGKYRDALTVYAAAAPSLGAAHTCAALVGTADAHWWLGDRAAATATLEELEDRGPDPACPDEAGALATRVAEAVEHDARFVPGGRPAAIAAWSVARALAAPGPDRRSAALAVARLAAEHATAIDTGAAWADAAEAHAAAVSAGAAGSAAAAIDAWRQAVARDPSLEVRATAALARLPRSP